jgi:hypothetical protein
MFISVIGSQFGMLLICLILFINSHN